MKKVTIATTTSAITGKGYTLPDDNRLIYFTSDEPVSETPPTGTPLHVDRDSEPFSIEHIYPCDAPVCDHTFHIRIDRNSPT